MGDLRHVLLLKITYKYVLPRPPVNSTISNQPALPKLVGHCHDGFLLCRGQRRPLACILLQGQLRGALLWSSSVLSVLVVLSCVSLYMTIGVKTKVGSARTVHANQILLLKKYTCDIWIYWQMCTQSKAHNNVQGNLLKNVAKAHFDIGLRRKQHCILWQSLFARKK